MSLELTTVEALDELLATFDSRYSTHAEAAKRAMMAFFATVRELQNSYNASLITQAQKLQEEKFALEVSIAAAHMLPRLAMHLHAHSLCAPGP